MAKNNFFNKDKKEIASFYLFFLVLTSSILVDFQELRASTNATDRPGEQVEHTYNLNDKITGYLVYLPEDYDPNSGRKYPMVLFLHGAGEVGANLNLIKRNGPPKMANQGEDFPFILVSPQARYTWDHNGPAIDQFVEEMKKNYKVDNNRFYVTGLSMGGAATWNYTTDYDHKVAAAVPICGWGNPSRACEMKDVPVWAFHNSGDGTVGVGGTINMVNALEKCPANPMPRETIYPVSGHDAWTATYNNDAMWDWMLSQNKDGVSKPININPVANAGGDKSLSLPVNNITLTGSGTDQDGSITAYLWTKTSGPNATLADANKATVKISDLEEGTYTFKLTVTDNAGASGSDEVKIVVNAADNKAPVANAGGDKSLSLPVNNITLTGSGTDQDGSITAYLWTKTSGPNATLADANKATVKISDLEEGTYTFKLTVTDNAGASGSDEMKVVVNAADNKAPVANAGGDKNLTLPVNSITLTGSGTDQDGSITAYLWTKTSGPNATLADANKATVKISDLEEGSYTFKLTVTDNAGANGADEVKVVVDAADNKAPVANAGYDRVISLPQNSVTVAGTASDQDGTIVSYSWTKVSGPAASMSNIDKASMDVSDMKAGIYIFRLTVKDNQGASASDEVKIKVNNPPLANAGLDKNVQLPLNNLYVSGAGSDTDGTITYYEWKKISGGSVTMSNSKTHLLSLTDLNEGTYKFELTVKDNDGASAKDEVIVTVTPPNNIAPTSNAGKDITVQLPENSVMLDGSGSDADGTIVKYKWTQVSGKSLMLNDTSSPSLLLLNLDEGVFEFELEVTDNKGASDKDKTIVTVLKAKEISPLVLNITKHNISCFGENDGSAEVEVIGGAAPYSYNWSIGVQEQQISNLGPGTYELIVTDSKGERASSQIEIISPDPIEIKAKVSNEIVGKGLGGIILEITGGTAPYKTKWLVNDEEVQDLSGHNLKGLYSNKYTVEVTDAMGCTTRKTYNVKKAGRSDISLYPNPSEGDFKVGIEASGGDYVLTIYDSKGKLIHKEEGTQSDVSSPIVKEYDLTSQEKGIYFVKVQYESGTHSIRRLIIN